MGIDFSSSPYAGKQSWLQLPVSVVENCVISYFTYHLPPVQDENGYKFFMMVSLSDCKDDAFAREISQTYWDIFNEQNS